MLNKTGYGFEVWYALLASKAKTRYGCLHTTIPKLLKKAKAKVNIKTCCSPNKNQSLMALGYCISLYIAYCISIW